MIIEINKDIDKYQETVVLGLTARQLLFSTASVLAGGGIVLLLYKFIGLTGAAYVAVPCIAPIALQGFYSFNGMTFMEYWKKKIYFMTANKALNYESTEGDAELEMYKRVVLASENSKNGVLGIILSKKEKSGDSAKFSSNTDINEDTTTAGNTTGNKEDFEKMKEKMKRTLLATAIGLAVAIICAIIARQFI